MTCKCGILTLHSIYQSTISIRIIDYRKRYGLINRLIGSEHVYYVYVKLHKWIGTYSKRNIFIQNFAQFKQHCAVMNSYQMKIQCTLFNIVEYFNFTLHNTIRDVNNNFSQNIPCFKFASLEMFPVTKHLQGQILSF